MPRHFPAVAAAALVLGLTANEADAARKSITLDGTCDTAAVTAQPSLPNVWTYSETKKSGSCDDAFGVGTVGKAVLDGTDARWISFGLANSGAEGEQGNLVVQYPLVTGGAWIYYVTTNGKTAAIFNKGTYTVGATGAAKDAPSFRHPK